MKSYNNVRYKIQVANRNSTNSCSCGPNMQHTHIKHTNLIFWPIL